MGNQCTYYPEPGPEGDTGAGGVCLDCMDEGYATYFCSQVCYETNLVRCWCKLRGGSMLTIYDRRHIERPSTTSEVLGTPQTSWISSIPRETWRLLLHSLLWSPLESGRNSQDGGHGTDGEAGVGGLVVYTLHSRHH